MGHAKLIIFLTHSVTDSPESSAFTVDNGTATTADPIAARATAANQNVILTDIFGFPVLECLGRKR